MNDQTRINTLIDTVTELRQQLADMTAKHASEAESAEYRRKWWQEEKQARIDAEARLAAAIAEVTK